ncbi:MAG: hypothetical protein ACRDJU_04990 [Actinomycetota bacterium]
MLDLPVWGLDRPLSYRVPEELRGAVIPGVIVRAPLRGRRVRGWVVATDERDESTADKELAAVLGVSGPAPVFDAALLRAARAMARYYVHPLSSFLRLITPPQMGRPLARRAGAGTPAAPPGELRVALPTCTLRRLGPREDPVAGYVGAIAGALDRGRGAIVVVPEVREGSIVLGGLERAFPKEAAVVHSGQEPAERSRALWSVARGERRVVVGGRAAALVPALPASSPLGLVIVHAEEDRTLREQRSPYYDAREVAERRAAAAGADLLLASAAPTLRSWRQAAEPRAGPTAGSGWRWQGPTRSEMRSAWPIVELIEPSRSVMPERAVEAILTAWRAGIRVLVLVPRRERTTAGPGPAEVVAHLRKFAPRADLQRADPPSLASGSSDGATGTTPLERALRAAIIVATEGALADVERPPVGTAVALGVNALIHRPGGRSAEQAFTTLWELASLVAHSRVAGTREPARVLLETDEFGHHVVQAVQRGDYDFFARQEVDERRNVNAPPFATLVRVRAGAPAVGGATLDRLAALPGTELLGPVEGRLGPEVLLKVGTVDDVLDQLRAIVVGAPERLVVEMDPREW